jgi:hypothetical protein
MVVVLSNPRVPHGKIRRMLSCPICRTLNLPLVYPVHETNDTLMLKADKFASKHITHK